MSVPLLLISLSFHLNILSHQNYSLIFFVWRREGGGGREEDEAGEEGEKRYGITAMVVRGSNVTLGN